MDLGIRAKGLSKSFGELAAVQDLDLEISRGELFGLVGPDGAGKTTTLRMLAGILPPSSGDAEVAGFSVVSDPEGAKHHLAYMSQRFGLYTDLTVRENLDFYADLFEVPHADLPSRIDRLFSFSRLGPFQDRLAGNLSGGMKQKLGLCCALIHHPEVLLLDEPTFGVDPISRRDLWLIVHEMVADGMTALVSTAYMDEAERFDRLALLHRGQVLDLDRPQALQASLEGRVLSLQAEDLRAARQAARGIEGVQHAGLFGDRIHLVVDSSDRDPQYLVSALESAGVHSPRIRPTGASMEDVFLQKISEADAA